MTDSPYRKGRCVVRAALSLLVTAGAWAQPSSGLRITIAEGEGAINNIRQRVNRDPIVQVEDENKRPVAGAAVVFFLPEQGAGGTFLDGARMLTVSTDAEGRAVARGFRPNSQTGQFEIRVTASSQGRTASTIIHQMNAAGTVAGSAGAGAGMTAGAKILLVLGIAGGAAVAGIAAGGRGSPSGPANAAGPPAPGLVVVPGAIVVGGPR